LIKNFEIHKSNYVFLSAKSIIILMSLYASICGPFAVVVSYLAEFHGKKHRPYIMLFVGLCVSIGSMILPLLAYALMPVPIFFKVATLECR